MATKKAPKKITKKASPKKPKLSKIITERKHSTDKQLAYLTENMPHSEVIKFICELDNRLTAVEKKVK